jgi:hypothetical protein
VVAGGAEGTLGEDGTAETPARSSSSSSELLMMMMLLSPGGPSRSQLSSPDSLRVNSSSREVFGAPQSSSSPSDSGLAARNPSGGTPYTSCMEGSPWDEPSGARVHDSEGGGGEGDGVDASLEEDEDMLE